MPRHKHHLSSSVAGPGPPAVPDWITPVPGTLGHGCDAVINGLSGTDAQAGPNRSASNRRLQLRRLRHALPSPEPLIHRPELLPSRFRITVIGDVRIDVRAQLRARRFEQIDSDHQEEVPITTEIGGTGISFARAALPHFRDVHVIGAIGRDGWSDFIYAKCAQGGIEGSFLELPMRNSPVVVLRDQATTSDPDGSRLLLSDTPSTYQYLDAKHVVAHARQITAADALVVDGYALLGESSTDALLAGIELAVGAGVPVFFDVVPHTIDRLVDFARIRPIVRRSSVVSVEAPTLLRLLGEPVPSVVTRSEVCGLLDSLPDDLVGWRRTWMVRFGVGMMDETVAGSRYHHHVYYRTGYATAQSPGGYGYRVFAAEVQWWLTNYRRAIAVYPDLVQPARRR